MNPNFKKTVKHLLSNRVFSFGSVLVLTLLLTGVLSTSPSINEVNVAAAPTGKPTATAPAMTVTVTADGATKTLTPADGTVADALESAGIILGEDDKVEPSEKAALRDGLEITVTRISFVERVELETISYETKKEETSSLDEGETKVKQEGVDGLRERVYCDKIVNGVTESSSELRSSVVSNPTDEIVLVGKKKAAIVTAPAGVVTDASGVPTNYTSCLTGTATAYTNDRGLAGDWTASGLPAQVGVVAVNPDVIPLGTHLYIASPDGSIVYGYAIAGDTGGAMYGGEAMVDLFYDTYEECIRFGRRTMNIYILD